MRPLFDSLLRLYPPAYRREYEEEMISVLLEVDADVKKQSGLAQLFSYARETGGLLCGALHEHMHNFLFPHPNPVFSSRRFPMRSEFRFPKSTVTLMIIILLAVIVTIEKAESISAAAPHTNPDIGLIHPVPVTVVPTFLIVFAGVSVIAGLSWLVLFALHRSGTQRFTQLSTSAPRNSGTTLLG